MKERCAQRRACVRVLRRCCLSEPAKQRPIHVTPNSVAGRTATSPANAPTLGPRTCVLVETAHRPMRENTYSVSSIRDKSRRAASPERSEYAQ